MKGQMLKLFVVVTVCLSVAAGCVASPPPPTPVPLPPTSTPVPPSPTPVPPTPAPDLTAPVKAWVDALNSGDVDAALALFTDDVKFSVFEYNASNKDQLRGIFDWLTGLETKYQIKECQTKEDRIVCTMPGSDACIAGYDPINGLATTMIFVPTQDGKIAQVNGMVDGFDDYYAKWISPAMTWMRANRAEELAKAESTSDGREAGAINAKLCKEYGESLKAAPTSAAPTSAIPSQVKAWAEAINQGDVDAAVAPFADDVQYHFIFDATDKEQLRGVADWLTAISEKYEVNDCRQPQSDRAMCIFTSSDACLTAFGAPDGLASTGTFVFQKDGKIGQVSGTTEGADWDSYWKWLDAVISWASTNRPDALAEYAAKPMTREVAPVLLKLCQEYAESLKATPTPTPAAAADSLPIIKAYEDAVNRGDVDAVAALFADRATYMLSGGAVGRDEIREFEGWQAGLNKQLEFTDCKTAGNTVTCKGFQTDDCDKAVGGLGVRLDEVTFKVDDGKIQNVYGSASDVDAKRSDENGTLAMVWAQSNRPEDYAKYINPTKAGHTTRQNGQLFLQMCQQAAKDPSFLVELWGAAFYRDDLDGVMGLFVDDGLSFTMGEISGDNQVARDTLEYIRGFNGKFDITDCKAKGQQVVCALALVDDYCVKAEGLKAVHYQAAFKFKDNRIQTLDAKMAAADGSAVSAFGDKLGAWATANRPEDWKKYQNPAAAGITPRQNGELIATLCKGYLDNQK